MPNPHDTHPVATSDNAIKGSAQNKTPMNAPIAIIGMGAIFPKALGLKHYWHLIFNGIDAITTIPEESHWSLKDYFDADPATPDHTYCKRGGFLPKVNFDPARYSFPPANLEATDTSQLLGLMVAEMALEDAGYPDKSPNFTTELKRRTNVILGVTGTQELVIPLGGRLYHPHWKKALDETGIPQEKRDEILQRMADKFPQWQENSFPGLLGNVVAGRIANRLDLGGTNTVVDAACASSLSALHTACLELQSGRCDMSITGGVDTLNDIFMHMCFSKTGVLSHTSDAKPFSKDADGTVLGEGVGMVVLKRLSDAERDKDRIYAVIKGIGTSSDGKTGGIYAPDSGGQLRALHAAYGDAGIDPHTVELFEAHGTGTRVGDKIEFSALSALLSENPLNIASGITSSSPFMEKGLEGEVTRQDQKGIPNQKSRLDQTKETKSSQKPSSTAAIGSVKSMIGHAKAAAGVAGLIKAALSLHHKVILPTLKAETPDPALKIEKSPLYLNALSKPWTTNSHHPRRSGVSAFGFGGSNFHIVLEETTPSKGEISWDGSVEIIAFSSQSKDGLQQAIQAFKDEISSEHHAPGSPLDDLEQAQRLSWHAAETRKRFDGSNAFRILMTIHQGSGAVEKCETMISFFSSMATDLSSTEPHGFFIDEKERKAFEKEGIYLGMGKHDGKIAFLFPGQGSQYTGMERELMAMFPEAVDALSLAQREVCGGDDPILSKITLTDAIFPPPAYALDPKAAEEKLRKTDVAQPAIGAVSIAMAKILKRFGIHPDATCGHSFGELSALCIAGRLDEKSFYRLAGYRGQYMAKAAESGKESGSMLAIKAPLEKIEQLIEDEKLDLILANRNSPEQGVLSGPSHEIKKAAKACKKRKMRAIKLPVAAAFHSKLVKQAAKPFARQVEKTKLTETETQVISNTTGKAYPHDAKKAAAVLGKQLSRPVDFVSDIETLLGEGVTTFIEVGPKNVLTGLTRSILDHRDQGSLDHNDQAAPSDPAKSKPMGSNRGQSIDNDIDGNGPRSSKERTAIVTLAMDGSNGKKRAIEDLAALISSLAAVGIPVALDQWEHPVEKPAKKMMRVPLTGANVKPPTVMREYASPAVTPQTQIDPLTMPTPPQTVHLQREQPNETPRPDEQTSASPKGFPPRMAAPKIAKSNAKPRKASHHRENISPNAKAFETSSHRQSTSPLSPTPKGTDMTTYQQNQFPPTDKSLSVAQAGHGNPQEMQNQQTPPWTPTDTHMNHDRMNMAPPQASDPHLIFSAMQLVQQGMASMQELQARTAQAHEKFLETQTTAGHTLQAMMEQTRFFAQHAINGAGQAPLMPQGTPSLYSSPSVADSSTHAAPSIANSNNHTAPTRPPYLERPSAPMPNRNNGRSFSSEIASGNMFNPYRGNNGESHSHSGTSLNLDTAPTMAQPKPQAVAPSHPTPAPALQPQPSATPAPRENIEATLLETVSKLTGFPTEMLTLDMDIESDLGIDSIKRVEIVSELEKAIPGTDALTPENMGTLRTLKDIVAAIAPESGTLSAQGTTGTTDITQTTTAPSTTALPSTVSDHTASTGTSLAQTSKSDAQKNDLAGVMTILMETISELTGFPTEMLTPEMDLESDLGIDSIKRVEILSNLEQKLPEAATLSPDDLGTLKTLAQIAERIAGPSEEKAVSEKTSAGEMETTTTETGAKEESKKNS